MASFSDQHAVLLETTLKSNNKVLEENRKLQEDIKSRDETHKKLIEGLVSELKQLKEQNTEIAKTGCKKGKKKTTKRVQIPSTCRVSPIYLIAFVLNSSDP